MQGEVASLQSVLKDAMLQTIKCLTWVNKQDDDTSMYCDIKDVMLQTIKGSTLGE